MRRLAILVGFFCLLAARSHAADPVADDVNGNAFPGFYIFDPALKDVGWYYTPDHDYTLKRIETKFRGSTGRAEDVDRVVTFNVYTERPSAGGTLMASESFNTSLGRGVFIGANLNHAVDLKRGTKYFIGLLAISGLGVNMYDWAADGNDCNQDPGTKNLLYWAASTGGQTGVFDNLIGPTVACPYNPFAAPILLFYTPPPPPKPTPFPTPTVTPTPTPGPTPLPTPCVNDLAVPSLTGADLPYQTTIQTAANLPGIDFGLGGYGYDDNAPGAMWYFTPPATGRYQIEFTGYDTVLGVFDGDCCDPVQLAIIDNSYGGEYASYNLAGGHRYLLAAKGDVSGAFGALTFKLNGPILPAANDICSGALVVDPNALPYNSEVNNTNAADTYDSSASRAATSGTTPDLWWTFTPQVSGKYEIRAVGKAFDTILSVFTGSCGSFSEVASVDNPAYYWGEHVVLSLTAGTTYYILVETRSELNRGPVEFSVRGPGAATANASCATATVISPASLPFDTIVDTTFNPSTKDGSVVLQYEGGGGAPDAWYRFTPTASGKYVIGLRAQDFVPGDPNIDLSLIAEALTLYTGSCGALTEVQSNESGYGAMIAADLQAGVPYTILVEGVSSISDFGKMRLYLTGPAQPSPNNACDGSIEILPEQLPYQSIVNTIANTNSVDPSASSIYAGGGAPDAWYAFTPATSGIYAFEADLDTGGLGLNIDLSIGVYSPNCTHPAEFDSVDSGDGPASTPERLAISLVAGQRYLIAVDGYLPDDAGPITFRVNGPFVSSGNDHCSSEQSGLSDWMLYKSQ